jgi:hypothetical protein
MLGQLPSATEIKRQFGTAAMFCRGIAKHSCYSFDESDTI